MLKKKRWKIVGLILLIGAVVRFLNIDFNNFVNTDKNELIQQANHDLEKSFELTGYENYTIKNTDIIYKKNFSNPIDVGSRMGYLTKTAVIKMDALIKYEGKETLETYRATFHQLNSDYWTSGDLENMIKVGNKKSVLTNWAENWLESEYESGYVQENHKITSKILSDKKQEDPINGTSRKITVKLQYESSEDIFVGKENYSIDFYQYSNDQNFWTNGEINDKIE